MKAPPDRNLLFISKATPGDDEFALWLAPRLEAAGYEIFADILSLEPGTRGRKEITETLQQRAIKMLLCGRTATLQREGVQEEIGIAEDLAKELKDPKFIIPLRLEKYKKVFGIGELQYINFERGWSDGLIKLLAALQRQRIPKRREAVINPHWEAFRRRSAIRLVEEPERLTSNWLRVAECPDVIRYFEPTGASDPDAMVAACSRAPFPAVSRNRGFFAFAIEEEINDAFASAGRFRAVASIELPDFIREGSVALDLKGKDAASILSRMYRSAWERFCITRGLVEYRYSMTSGFHAGSAAAKIGERIPWGMQGDRRSSMLRNEAKGHIWQFGVTGLPAFWPFQHFKLKARVIFAPRSGDDVAAPYDDKKKQHRLRRSVCKGWRNKQWHGRLMAMLEVLAGESSFIALELGPSDRCLLESTPMLFTSPVSTALPNLLQDEDEEQDESTLGRPEPEEETE
ncbi:MAG: toll/interleukin-1 receptor domain-containing protein [Dongiaceae bacterium]